MRNLSKVIDNIVKYIPEEEYDLVEELKEIKAKMKYCPDELIIHFWKETMECLWNMTPRSDEHFDALLNWEKNVILAFNGHIE
jgi:hypothetical protein